jgi:dTDP-4-dehydrorhamnose 3,5-epimerase
MRFRATPIGGVFVIEIEARGDDRGFFARTWCAREFREHGLADTVVQTSISQNARRGTLRGMHLQLPPSLETKVVRCTRGSIYDVVVDLRPDSPTFLQHFGVELSSAVHNALLIPPLFLHGFQTLADESEVFYQMSDFYAPELGFGARWDDPAFAIAWPMTTGITILPRDAEFPDFDADEYRGRLRAAQSARPA